MKAQITPQDRLDLSEKVRRVERAVNALTHGLAYQRAMDVESAFGIVNTLLNTLSSINSDLATMQYSAEHMRPRVQTVRVLGQNCTCTITCHPQAEGTWADVEFDCADLPLAPSATARFIMENALRETVKTQLQDYLVYPIKEVSFDWED